ncbi:MAG: FAD-dependent oxidoreductase, partial [Verrucomicrobiae bacterium]|nr:FAD-dependent oxidoreductase [Verrucomicrobiae bacterium]
MKPIAMSLRLTLWAVLSLSGLAYGVDAIVESAREIPVAYDVDVVIVGGGVGAITAAVEASKQGASVFLAAPRPYLGEDVAGTLRLWLEKGETPESELEKKVFERIDPVTGFPNRLSFTYEADQQPNAKHKDAQGTMLADGKWQNAPNESVQYDTDTTVIADLGKMARLESLHLMAFERAGEFVVSEVQVATSPNGKLWRDLGSATRETDAGGSEMAHFSLPVKQACRFVKVTATKASDAQRILLGELLLLEEKDAAVDETAPNLPATPMQVKVALDDALLAAGVKYLYGAMVTDVLKDEKGQPAGVVMTNRAGRQAVRAKVVIDATARATAARAAGVDFAPYPAGTQTFQRIVAGGEVKAGDGIRATTADVKFYSADGPNNVFVYQLDLPMPDASPASFAKAEVLAREKTFDAALVDESDVLFQVPPDPMAAKAEAAGETIDPQTLNLASLQPKPLDRFYVLGGCAGVSRTAAATLLHPLVQMRLGTRVGAAAAETAKAANVAGNVSVSGAPATGAEKAGDVMEGLQGARPTDRGLPTVSSPERALPVLGEYDVVVAGGGTGGAPAG